MTRALIFDVDGTLSETEEVHRLAFNRAFSEHGLTWRWSKELYRRLLEVTGGKERIRYFLQHFDQQDLPASVPDAFVRKLHAAKTAIYTDYVRAGRAGLRPGVRDTLRCARARGVRLAIATTTSLPNVEALVLSALGQEAGEVFEVIAAGDSVKNKKPAPDIYLSALDALGESADSCIAVEDSRNGLLSALGAGIRTIITPSAYTTGQDFTGAALVVPDLGDPRVRDGRLFRLPSGEYADATR